MLNTDYLVAGTGASGLAFTDTLIPESAADVLLVDRRHDPVGHRCESYPFVRLHSPSRYYGVDSVPLGAHQRQVGGDPRQPPRAGQRRGGAGHFPSSATERARAVRACAVPRRYQHVGGSGGNHVVRALACGVEHEVRVRRSMVDAGYLAGDIPATQLDACLWLLDRGTEPARIR